MAHTTETKRLSHTFFYPRLTTHACNGQSQHATSGAKAPPDRQEAGEFFKLIEFGIQYATKNAS